VGKPLYGHRVGRRRARIEVTALKTIQKPGGKDGVENFGRGMNPRWRTMLESRGYETAALLGMNPKAGDFWKMLRGNCRAGWVRSASVRTSHDDTGDGSGGISGSTWRAACSARETVRVLVRASSSNRAISDLPLEYVTGDLRDAASLDRAMAGVQRVYHVAADYRLWAKRTKDIYDSNVGGTKNLLRGEAGGVKQLI